MKKKKEEGEGKGVTAFKHPVNSVCHIRTTEEEEKKEKEEEKEEE